MDRHATAGPSEDGATGGAPAAHQGRTQHLSGMRLSSQMKRSSNTLANDMPELLTAGLSHGADGARPLEHMPRQPSGLASRWLQSRWPLFVALAILFGLYHGLNQLIGLRSGPPIAAWKPFVWELSSILVILALSPLIVRMERRFRLDARPRSRIVVAHAVAAIVFSAVHTTSMVMLRKIVYAFAGDSYEFGSVFVGGFYELQIDPGLDTLKVPRLLLQPLVENAFRHGLAEGRGCVKVSVRRAGQRLSCTISDDGVGLPVVPPGHGTGLSNVSRRLQLLFPHDHELTLAAREPRGTVVTVAFPASE